MKKTHKNKAGIDCYYAIGVLLKEGMKFVTDIDNENSVFVWEDGKEPLFFSRKEEVDRIAAGMIANWFPAVVLEIPSSYNLTK